MLSISFIVKDSVDKFILVENISSIKHSIKYTRTIVSNGTIALFVLSASIASMATPAGCILTGWLMDAIGRKKAILITQVPVILGWIIIASATNVPMIYAGRMLTGLGSGMIGAPSRVYTSEVTQPHLRGMLGALASVGISFGVLFQYTMGSFATWQVLSGVSALCPLMAFVLMLLMPESPNYLVGKEKPAKATKCLAKLRGSTYNVEQEVNTLKVFAEKQRANSNL